MAYADTAPVPFEIGRVVRRATAVLQKRALLIFGAAVILQVLPNVLMEYGQLYLTESHYTGPFRALVVGGAAALILFVLFGMLMLPLLVSKVAIDEMIDGQSDFGSLFGLSLRSLLPLLGLYALMGMGIGLGMMLLLVPGIMLAVAWSLSPAILVAEREGVIASLERSRELTRGARWPLFGLFVVAWVLYYILAVGFFFVRPAPELSIGNLLAGGVQNLAAVGGFAIIHVLMAAAFIELREVKEGAPTSQLAEVFA